MALYFGKAGNAAGNTQPFSLDADDRDDLNRRLALQGLFPLQVQEFQRGVTSSAFWRNLVEGRVPMSLVVGFTRSLAVMLESGLSLVDSIHAIAGRERDPDAVEVFSTVAAALEHGDGLATALSRHPDVFPSYYVHSIQAGERSAALASVLEKLAQDMDLQLDLRSRFSQAMVYPAVLAGGTASLFLLSTNFVLPKFVEFYDQMGLKRPFMTDLVLGSVDFVWKNIILLVLLASLVAYRLTLFFRTKEGKETFDAALLEFPLIGPMVRTFRLGAMARNLALMKESGMPLPEALEVLAAGEPSPTLARSLELARRYLEYGNPPSVAFEGARLLDPDDLRLVRAGEESDKLGPAFRRVASEKEREMVRLTERLASLIPPFLLIIAGGVVVALVGATLFPMLEMVKTI